MWSRVKVRKETVLHTLPPHEHVTDFRNVLVQGNQVHVHLDPEDKDSEISVQQMDWKLQPAALASFNLPNSFPIRVHRSPLKCQQSVENASLYFIKPYHINNMAHLFNENILPLIDTMEFPQVARRMLVTFPAHGTRGQSARPIWMATLKALHIETVAHIPQGCVQHLVWGLGVKPFWHPHRLTQSRHTVARFRASIFPALSLRFRSSESQIMLIVRRAAKSQRSLDNTSFALLESALQLPSLHCCDFQKTTMRQQLQIISRASLVIGLHGAGLMNVLFAKQNAVLVELFGSKGLTWVVHRRAVQTIQGGYIAVHIEERQSHHLLHRSHAQTVRDCVRALWASESAKCLKLPYVMNAVAIGDTWDCRNEGESGEGLNCPTPSWQEEAHANVCVKAEPIALTVIDLQRRCHWRAITLTRALSMCESSPECAGVTRDNGIICSSARLHYELRKFPFVSAKAPSWVLNRSTPCTHTSQTGARLI
jgi:hypothetical protein